MSLSSKNEIDESQLFRATVDALELEDIRLLVNANEIPSERAPTKPEKLSRKSLSLKDVFQAESENKTH